MTESAELRSDAAENAGEQQQQRMDHQRFESMYLQHVDNIKAIAAMRSELKTIQQQHKEQASFANVIAALIVILMAGGFLSMLTIIGYTH